jgi:hypothetical protein
MKPCGTEINDNTVISMMLYAGEQALTSDNLQRALCTLHNITKQSGQTSKVMARNFNNTRTGDLNPSISGLSARL